MNMSGAHRHVVGNPVTATVETARSLLTIIAIIAAIPALAFAVYLLIFVGTNLEFLVALGLLWTALLISAIVRRDQSGGWLAAGVILVTAWQLVSALAQRRGWPAGQLHFIALAGDAVRLIAVACIAAAIVTGIRSGRLLFWRRPSRDATKSAGG